MTAMRQQKLTGPGVAYMPVPSGLLQRKCACSNGAPRSGECAESSKKNFPLQRRTRNLEPEIRNSDGVPRIVQEVLRSPGQPLDPVTRGFFEPRFGHDFSQVRVHTDSWAAESASSVNALAYTVGQHMVFGDGQYSHASIERKHLLAHELAHVMQQKVGGRTAETIGSVDDLAEREAEMAAAAVVSGKQPTIHFMNSGGLLRRAPISEELRMRIKLCIDPFYYDKKGRYRWMGPEPDCTDMIIPADRDRAWKCVDKFYWSPDGTEWEWPFEPEPKCSDLRLPVRLSEARAESPEEQARLKQEQERFRVAEVNRARIAAIRDESPSDVEALARMFIDLKIVDDGTVVGRLNAVLDATAHEFIPGLHTGIKFGQSGLRKEFHDPWTSSINQVGHFLTAVRLAFNPDVTNDLILLTILDAWGDSEVPLRLIIGHEKEPDPSMLNIFSGFKAQYRATTAEDIRNFKLGKLDAIKVGRGLGNSMADLSLSHKGWMLGRWIAEGHFKSKKEIADWIRKTIGMLKD